MNLLAPKEFLGLTEAECVRVQEELSPALEPWDRTPPGDIRSVAGVDLAYWQEGGRELAVCCIVVLDAWTGAVLEETHCAGEVRFPYIPGCFAFRELPLVLETASRLTEKPGLYLFDGNGVLHPRGLGLASHASFYLNTPTAGIAKSFYQVAGAVCPMPEDRAGAWADITKDGQILGRVLRTHTGVKPVYLSVGNWVSLDTVTELALRLTGKESRVPLPTRLADLATHEQRGHLKGTLEKQEKSDIMENNAKKGQAPCKKGAVL